MQATLYANADNSAPQNLSNPSLAPENQLDLLFEHTVLIDRALHQQMMATDLDKNEARIVLAIYDQTTGYNKLEDDMNGTRLQQLTGIRNDHANAVIRSLEQKNVIVTRKGNYGKWMSINFDFAHWGMCYYGIHNNDPSILLPAYYQNTPVDTGLNLSQPLPPENKKPTEEAVEKSTPVSKDIASPVNKPIEKPVEKSTPTSGDAASPVNKPVEKPVEKSTPASGDTVNM